MQPEDSEDWKYDIPESLHDLPHFEHSKNLAEFKAGIINRIPLRRTTQVT